MVGRHCKSPKSYASAARAGLIIPAFAAALVGAALAPGAIHAASSSDPAELVQRLVGDLDLQTKMPGDIDSKKPDETPSDVNLKIPGATTILWVAIALAVILVLYALLDYVPGFSRRDKTKAEVAAEQAQSLQSAERMVQAGDEADELAASGRIAEAMHLLLLRSLVELRRRLGITFADSLTRREILARLTLPEDGRLALADLIRRVEFAHFGAKPSAAEDYEACRESYERLIAAMLADEIKRTPPKTQAALLQAMNERTVTIDTHTHSLGDDFMVVATQNPIEQHGTYPLPEAQLDRFLFKISVGYPTRDEERAIVARHGHQSSMPRIEDFGIEAVADPASLAGLRSYTSRIRLDAAIIDYIVDVMRATREHPAIETGASTRAANMLASAVRSYAALNGRDFVLPDDVKRLAVPLVRHRIVMAPHAEIDGTTSDAVLAEILDGTAAPR